MIQYVNTLSFARSQDDADELRKFRDHFLFPKHNGTDVFYFCGNSLGLQPRGAREALMQECSDWEQFGVEGHFLAKNPWYSYHEMFSDGAAKLVGANQHEVVMMNQLTVNLNLLLISFYQPAGKRRKIIFETRPFPSDRYAFESHAKLNGLDPKEVLIELLPREGEITLRTRDILEKIRETGDELALVCIGAVNYFTGQYFDLEKITAASHEAGAMCGFDLAHAAGNLDLRLHDWNVDFACWCTYKYLNSGPGSVGGVYIHEKHSKDKNLKRLAGWWGHNKNTRFRMEPEFDPMESTEAWQMSNAPVFNMAIHKVALDIFSEAGMPALRKKSIALTGYLEFIIGEVSRKTGQELKIITPVDPESRGCQLSIIAQGRDRSLVDQLLQEGVVIDWREPNVMRMAPVPLYNSFEDVFVFGEKLTSVLS